jgi:hypothetical protein
MRHAALIPVPKALRAWLASLNVLVLSGFQIGSAPTGRMTHAGDRLSLTISTSNLRRTIAACSRSMASFRGDGHLMNIEGCLRSPMKI